MTDQIQAGSQRYLELLRNTGDSAEFWAYESEQALYDNIWAAWRDLRNARPALVLQTMATTGMALLRHLTGTDIPTLVDSASRLHIDKNAGYAGIGNADPWANFRLATEIGVSAYDGVLVRLSDKFIRLNNLRANPANNRVNESIQDTLADLIAYALIAICIWEEDQA